MKIAAIAGRGSRKDFVDLYVACTESLTLREAMSAFERKFGEVPYERYHVLKSLTYFDDAEAELMPEMLNQVTWEQITEFFVRGVPALMHGP